MTNGNNSSLTISRPVLAVALILIAVIVVAGLYYLAVFLPAQNTVLKSSKSDAGPIRGNAQCKDSGPDNTTCCDYQLNLQEENRNALVPPTVVDINEATGNLLVRGPMPLTIRNGAGRPPVTWGCRNLRDWSFAYANLSEMISAEKTFTPAYFPQTKKASLQSGLAEFNLSDYQLIDISLEDSATDRSILDTEKRSFGGTFSQCTASLKPSTIDGLPGSLIVSTVGFCDNVTSTNASCQQLLITGVPDTYCSYANLISQIDSLMKEKDPSGKKRLIYFHCVLGRDRTGGVTMGYLMKVYGLSYADALTSATNLGNPGGPQHPPDQGSQTLALAYCQLIGDTCPSGSNAIVPVNGTSVPSLPTNVMTGTAIP